MSLNVTTRNSLLTSWILSIHAEHTPVVDWTEQSSSVAQGMERGDEHDGLTPHLEVAGGGHHPTTVHPPQHHAREKILLQTNVFDPEISALEMNVEECGRRTPPHTACRFLGIHSTPGLGHTAGGQRVQVGVPLREGEHGDPHEVLAVEERVHRGRRGLAVCAPSRPPQMTGLGLAPIGPEIPGKQKVQKEGPKKKGPKWRGKGKQMVPITWGPSRVLAAGNLRENLCGCGRRGLMKRARVKRCKKGWIRCIQVTQVTEEGDKNVELV